MKPLILLLFLYSLGYTQTIKIASYNVQNLFDLQTDNTEYTHYIPNSKGKWNRRTHQTKHHNIQRVIKELDAHIIALQEIESLEALTTLKHKLNTYRYHSFIKHPSNPIGLGLLSRFPIISQEKISILSAKPHRRPIQKVTVQIGQHHLDIYNNHWPSKKSNENERIEYALALKNLLDQQPSSKEYILVGDFNSNYNEMNTFKHKPFNNTDGITGINHVLNTVTQQQFIKKFTLHSMKKQIIHYLLWLDLPLYERFSYQFRGQPNTPDHIIVPKTLLDNKNIDYINNSFSVFKPSYLFAGQRIQTFHIRKNQKGYYSEGYSDHLPIYAYFSTLPQNKTYTPPLLETIQDLYTVDSLHRPITLKNCIVIYKHNHHAIIKQPNNRAIFIYHQAKDLEIGHRYDITVKQIKYHYGLKEITHIGTITKKAPYQEYKRLYTDATHIDLHHPDHQNEIIYNLKGHYEKGYLYYTHNNANHRIKLYTTNKALLPNKRTAMTIQQGHLTAYNTQPQIKLYSKSDFHVN